MKEWHMKYWNKAISIKLYQSWRLSQNTSSEVNNSILYISKLAEQNKKTNSTSKITLIQYISWNKAESGAILYANVGWIMESILREEVAKGGISEIQWFFTILSKSYFCYFQALSAYLTRKLTIFHILYQTSYFKASSH